MVFCEFADIDDCYLEQLIHLGIIHMISNTFRNMRGSVAVNIPLPQISGYTPHIDHKVKLQTHFLFKMIS